MVTSDSSSSDVMKRSGFSPQENPRPEYMGLGEVLKSIVIRYTREPLILTGLTILFHPYYQAVANWWVSQGYSERAFFVFALTLVHLVLYFGINGFFHACDSYGWLEEYKLDRTDGMIPKWPLIKKTIIAGLTGMLFVSPIMAWFLLYPGFKYFGNPSMTAPLSGWKSLWLQFALCNLVNDWGFYWAHRLFHSQWLYSRIHKQHHTYVGSIGFAAEYAHPIEGIFANSLPTIGGALLYGAHTWVFIMWLGNRLQQTYEAHSGYCFNGTWMHKIGLTRADDAAFHDFHHSTNKGNFGTLYLDHFFGTMDAWLSIGTYDGYIAKKFRRKNSDKNK
jgi:sterol desaturase/sphingolipid hydroxylase (fatty acid hydroxylase superfamily)